MVLNDISKEADKKDGAASAQAKFAKFELEGRLQVVMHQLQLRRAQYEVLKTITSDQIVDMYSPNEFKDMQVKWRKSLEMTFPKGQQLDEKLLVEFHQLKKNDLD